jgi:NHL repeat
VLLAARPRGRGRRNRGLAERSSGRSSRCSRKRVHHRQRGQRSALGRIGWDDRSSRRDRRGLLAPPNCGDGGSATRARLNFPAGVAVDTAGNVYIGDASDNEVRRVAVDGTIVRIAGDGTRCSNPASCGDGGAATSAQFAFPSGLALDSQGSLYVADSLDNEIRNIS